MATIQAPLQQFVALLQAPTQNLVYVLAAKERQGNETPSEGPLRYADTVTRDELTVTFESKHRPISAYVDALAAAGLVVDALGELVTKGPARRDAEPSARALRVLVARASRPDTTSAAWR